MDFGTLVGEAFGYAKEGLIGKWVKWILLLIATIILMLPLMGYTLRIYRGEKPAPEVNQWGTLFIDGIKYLIISLIYAIPVIIIFILSFGPLFMDIASGHIEKITPGAALTAGGGLILLIIVGFIIALFEYIGIIRFARTGSMGEAFNFGAISAHIGKIGWGSYIVALIIMMIILGIIEMILSLIPLIGTLLVFLLLPLIVMFQARYLCMVYDSAGLA
ncbi:MAG: DUF4013 domain-containing protein [Methanoregula sp.]